MTNTVLRVSEVAKRLGISTASVWNKSNPKHRSFKADFPKPFKVSDNVTGWLESEVNDYIQKLADQRKATQS